MVKKLTHHFFSSGIITLVMTRLGVGLFVLAVGLVVGYLTDTIIDKFGHTRSGTNYDRNRITHSTLTAPLIGIGLGSPLFFFFNFSSFPALAGFLAGCSHIFCDSFSQSGIFAPFSRWRLCRFSFDDWRINTILSLSGAALLVYGFLEILENIRF